jgi:hypothetical protein
MRQVAAPGGSATTWNFILGFVWKILCCEDENLVFHWFVEKGNAIP